MGSYDGAETCELVGSFLLSQLQDLNINVGLYRDDGLAITRDTENIKKEICRIFNNNGLRITIEANKQIINFLDVTFNHLQSRILHYNTFTARATTRQSPQRTFLPASTNDCCPYHLTKHPLTKLHLLTRKHSMKVDTTTPYSTNQPKQANGKADNATTSSGTTLPLAKIPVPTSDTNSPP